MREALVEAEKAYDLGEVPVGAVVRWEDKIVARAHNLREILCDSTAHAEILAMRWAAWWVGDWRLTEAIVYSTIEPCPMCAGALVQFRVKQLVYGAPDPKAGGVNSLFNIVSDPRLNHQIEVITGVLEKECGEIMKKFFQKLRKY